MVGVEVKLRAVLASAIGERGGGELLA